MVTLTQYSVKFRIIAYNYDESLPRRFVFTIREVGKSGHIRRYAAEIIENKNWIKEYSIIDVALILYAAEQDVANHNAFHDKHEQGVSV